MTKFVYIVYLEQVCPTLAPTHHAPHHCMHHTFCNCLFLKIHHILRYDVQIYFLIIQVYETDRIQNTELFVIPHDKYDNEMKIVIYCISDDVIRPVY